MLGCLPLLSWINTQIHQIPCMTWLEKYFRKKRSVNWIVMNGRWRLLRLSGGSLLQTILVDNWFGQWFGTLIKKYNRRKKLSCTVGDLTLSAPNIILFESMGSITSSQNMYFLAFNRKGEKQKCEWNTGEFRIFQIMQDWQVQSASALKYATHNVVIAQKRKHHINIWLEVRIIFWETELSLQVFLVFLVLAFLVSE